MIRFSTRGWGDLILEVLSAFSRQSCFFGRDRHLQVRETWMADSTGVKERFTASTDTSRLLFLLGLGWFTMFGFFGLDCCL